MRWNFQPTLLALAVTAIVAGAAHVSTARAGGPSFSEVAAGSNASSTFNLKDGMLSTRDMMPGGLAAGDVDNDGDIDLFLLQGDDDPALVLLNNGSGTFVSGPVFPGFGVDEKPAGASMADVNGDGLLDIVVTLLTPVSGIDFSHYGRGTRLFINQGGAAFVDNTDSWALLNPADAFSAAFGDINGDGWLDMAVSHWDTSNQPNQTPDGHLWSNNAGTAFVDVSAGPAINTRHDVGGNLMDTTFTPILADMDGDALPDLLYASDFCGTQAFRNNGDGTFTEWDSSQFDDENGMGSAVGDYDNDGDLDWFVSSIWNPADDSVNRCDGGSAGIGRGNTGNRLYRNDGNGVFTDVSAAAGVRHGYWGWGSCFADFNNDGWLDIFHVNGAPDPVSPYDTDPARLFINQHDGTFVEQSVAHQINDSGQGRGIACFDLEHDGDVDVYIANTFDSTGSDGVGRLYRNNAGGNGIIVQLRQAGPNSRAVGATVKVTTGALVQTQQLLAGNNFQSSNPQELHFGLGTAASADKVEVLWPGCTRGRYAVHDVAAGDVLVIDHENGLPFIGGFEDGNCD